MGKKRMTTLGSEDEAAQKAKKAVKLEQKKLREGKSVAKSSTESETPIVTSVAETEGETNPTPAPSTPASPSAPHVHSRSKAYKSMKQKIDSERTYSLVDGLKLLREVSLTKFDATVELHITLTAKGFSREVDLPHSTGKTKRVAVANDETIAKIEKGQIDFDVLLASPAAMPKLVKLARVLGPKGLMPNPKNGTVVPNPEEAAKAVGSRNSVVLKTEKDAPVIHTIVGKLSASDQNLTENIQSVVNGLAGTSVKKVVLKSTMSPAIKLHI